MRVNWIFGLFFDFSKANSPENTFIKLANHYKRLLYLSEYQFIERNQYFDQMISDGWFPFSELIGDGIEKLISYYRDHKHPLTIENLLLSFDKQRILTMTSRWWSNSIFNDKREILLAGINSHIENRPHGFISSVKILSTEIEGIIQQSYIHDNQRKGTMNELKSYITDKGKGKYGESGSLCFPEKFSNYLSDYIFQSFDIPSGKLPESRHTVAHGAAENSIYNQEFSLKLILTLDNIFMFL